MSESSQQQTAGQQTLQILCPVGTVQIPFVSLQSQREPLLRASCRCSESLLRDHQRVPVLHIVSHKELGRI